MNDGNGGFLAPEIHSGPFGWPSAAVADIDGDLDLDVIISTTVMRNRGDGTFDPAENLPALPLFTSTSDVAIADVTGDGNPDILGVKLASDDDGWMLIEGGSSGTFAGAAQYRVGQYARAIDTADMDNDGDLDTVIANGSSLTVKVHLNDGGTFGMPYTHTAGSSLTHGMDAADLDLDGDLDVVAGSYVVFRHMNLGDGTFEAFEIDTNLGRKFDFVLQDVNGDVYPDMLFVRHNDSPPYNLYVNLNNGDGSFGPTTTWLLQASCGTRDIEMLDWDNDGDADVAITDFLGCPGVEGVRLHLVENLGDGTFGPDNYVVDFTIPDTYRLTTGDFDQDGNADIVSTQSETLAFWKGNGDGTFQPPVESDIDPQPSNERTPWYITSADFNGDGILDIATANLGWTFRGENITVLLGNGDGTFNAVGLYYAMHALTLAGAGGLGTLDADGDGDLDLVAGARYGCDVVLLVNDGTGTFEITDRYGVNGNIANLRTGDFNNDGVTDVAAHIGYHFDGGLTILPGMNAEPPGDFNGDATVNAADLALLLGEWGPCPGCAADLSGDDTVDAADLALLLANWT